MLPAKESVRELLDRLPDDCSFEDVLYHLYVLQKVHAGLEDASAARVISHEQMMAELRDKWVAGRAK